jgi:predicted DCC family thiol-disulfide oxidoreductase YuxK
MAGARGHANLHVMTEPVRKIEVLYNATCPVCDAGMKQQRRMMSKEAEAAVAWSDVSCQAGRLTETGLTLDQVRRHFYVRDSNGRLYRGAEAAAALWKQTPGFRWLGHLISLPVIRTVARVSYDWLADRLYAWNKRKGRW